MARRVEQRAFGGAEVLEIVEVPIPTPADLGHDEVLIGPGTGRTIVRTVDERGGPRRVGPGVPGLVAMLVAALLALTACGGPPGGTLVTTPPTEEPVTPGGTTGLGIVGIYTRDLRASLAFYRRLGLDVPSAPDPRVEDYRLRLPTGQVLFWETWSYTQNALGRPYQPGTGDRRITLEFGFASPDDVTRMYDTLVHAGGRPYVPPTDWPGPVRYAMVVDPDGNQIGLRWPLAS